jgi:16S rRNA (guanine1207-N2)-methyltransferase
VDHYYTNNENLKSERRVVEYNVLNASFTFYTDMGVFSKSKVDDGSDLLIKSYLENNYSEKRILDVGCGYGVIGIVLSKLTNSEVDMVDVNKRSIHLTEMNIKKNKVEANAFYSDAYENVTEKYDIIITNPPIRVGKVKVLEILENAKNYLNESGELWFVIRKDQGALSIKNILEKNYLINIIDKSKGYFVINAKIR